MSSETTLQLRIPVAVIRLMAQERDGSERPAPDNLTAELLGNPGFTLLEDNLLLVAPTAGNEAVFDSAIGAIQRLQTAPIEAAKSPLRLSAVVFPGVAEIGPGRAALREEFLLDDLRLKAPVCGPGVHLTGHATNALELPRDLEPVSAYRGPSGKPVPLFRVGPPLLDRFPWRNPTIFDHTPRYVARSAAEEAVGHLLDEPVVRAAGPMGCGKSRFLWQLLLERSTPRIWLRIRPSGGAPSLAEQLARQLLDPTETQRADPLHPNLGRSAGWETVRSALADHGRSEEREWRKVFEDGVPAMLDDACTQLGRALVLVVDDAHLAGDGDVPLLSSVLSSAQVGSRLKVVFVGRGGAKWALDLDSAPRYELSRLSSDEMQQLVARTTEGLSIPSTVRERFTESVNGNPFAFEECLFSLVRERSLRRVYGSFFFGGDDSTRFRPSQRYIRHLEAEVSRLGPPLPVRLSSLVDLPLPASELGSASSLLGARIEPGWERAMLAAGVLKSAPSPWGDGVDLASAVDSEALACGFDDEMARAARHQLGELLALSGRSGEAHWSAYQLLAGTPEALEPLSHVFKTSFAAEIPGQELLDALTRELRLSRERQAERAELDILWRLLPLARDQGCLARYEDDLAHGIEIARSNPARLLALASVKAEIEQDAGEFQRAESTIKSALEAAKGVDVKRKALLMVQLGKLLLRRNRFVEAEQLFDNLLGAFGESGASALAATCLFHLGNIAFHTGRLEEALEQHERALIIRREQKLEQAVGSSLSALGTVAGAIGNYPQALDYYREARAALEREGQEAEVSFAMIGVARMLSRVGDYTSATGPARAALALREGRDDSVGEAIARMAVARNYLDMGRSDAALEEARKAHFQISMVSAEGPLAVADELLGEIQLSRRRPEDARRRLESALARHRKRKDENSATFTVAKLIETCLALGDPDGIREYTAQLKMALTGSPPSDLREVLYFRLFTGLEWLTDRGHKVGDPNPFLEKAYRSVLEKAGHLDHESRQRFLFQVPVNREIVDTATRHGLDDGKRNGRP